LSVSVEIRVRYAESDQMGIAYYSNYFVWFESARTELFRENGIPYSEMEKEGFFLPASECCCSYSAPARYDELLEVQCRISEVRTRAVRFRYHVVRDGTTIAKGHSIHVCTDKEARPRVIPPEIRKILGKIAEPESGRTKGHTRR
jgi:acyl-CoA thioester hydrolase